MFNFSSLFGAKYDNLCRVEVIGKNTISNYKALSKKLPIAPVLKSNAYGHGLVLVAKILDKLNSPFFCVDSLFEAYELAKSGIKSEILIMGYVSPENLRYKKLLFSFAAYDKQSLLNIAKYQPRAGIHLFIDTGMHREGIQLCELPEVLLIIKKNKIKIVGLMSHQAMPENSRNPEAQRQIRDFVLAEKLLKISGIAPKWIHTGKEGNVARTGLGLYSLKPALRFVAKIVLIKNINKGDKVGYDFTFTAKKKMKLAVLPAGYNEGIDRRLSNIGLVKIRNKFCRFVVTEVKNAKVGDETVIISDRFEDPNSLMNTAKLCNTIPYEITVHVNPSLKRLLV